MQPNLLENRQINCFCGLNFESCWFTPARWCHRQWRNLTSPIERDQCALAEVLKRILLAIPLALATLVAYLTTIPGFMTCIVCQTSNFFEDRNAVILPNGITVTYITVNGSNVVITNTMGAPIIGSNRLATRRIDLSASMLRAVELHTLGNVVITSGQEQYVEVTADDNLLDYLRPHVNGQRLVLKVREGISMSTRNPVTYHLHLPHTELNRLIVSGSGSMQVDWLEVGELNCEISGQGTISINNGHATRQSITISGQGSYNASNFQVDHSRITISGQGQARIHTDQSLNATISGMGECTYSGTPKQIDRTIFGMGRVVHV